MTSEPAAEHGSRRPRFPLVLTLAAAFCFAVMLGLGVWQLRRAAWKEQQLARIETLKHAAPVPIAPVLARVAQGADVTFTRVVADCAPGQPAPAQLKMTTDNDDWIARAISPCQIAAPPYDGVMVDRGFVASTRGVVDPSPSTTLPAPGRVVGVLFPRTGPAAGGLQHPAPMILVAETETPAPAGLVPTPYPGAGADQLQYVGAYWLTWFGLAGALACFYAALVWRRYHPKR